jgi:hypothetical protein
MILNFPVAYFEELHAPEKDLTTYLMANATNTIPNRHMKDSKMNLKAKPAIKYEEDKANWGEALSRA